MTTPSASHSYSHACRRRAIGQLYVELGLVTRRQLNEALVECARSRVTLPESLRALGYLG
jgi:hypothetical protein